MIQRGEYLDESGRSPFATWWDTLDDFARMRLTTALLRLTAGNRSNVKGVGQGVNELKVDFGPGYRVYFGWDDLQLVILLGGGTKKRQQTDIVEAQRRWRDYKHRKEA
jgi:putative addiction module killer protein